jgi:hypothetical protein
VWSVVTPTSLEVPTGSEVVRLAGGAISFPVALPTVPKHVVYIKHGATPPSECPGSAEAPAAEKGSLCVFATLESNENAGWNSIESPTGAQGAESLSAASRFGAIVTFHATGSPANVNSRGTWAVTAE